MSPAPLAHSASAPRFPENLPPHWRTHLADEKDKPYFVELTRFLKLEYESRKIIFPSRENILRALQLVDYPDVKVVILGQDPYHGDGQAIGLCFGVPDQIAPKPPSLVNIFKEIESDIGWKWDGKQSELTGWAHQGVLLLNTVLSVRKAQAFSHQGKGWEIFTDRIIEVLNARKDGIIFVLWGAAAQKKRPLLSGSQHHLLSSSHPSPLSAHRGFLGCRHFSKINSLLRKTGQPPIDWTRINQ